MTSSSIPGSSTHLERTTHEPRDTALHRVVLSDIEQVNKDVRILRLRSVTGEPQIQFLPGQFLDVYIPSIPQAGGFSLTSRPSLATEYMELAIQRAPSNPHVEFLSRPAAEILDTELRVRVGGQFTWPPPAGPPSSIKRLVLIAGGMGVNPLVSILSELHGMKRLRGIQVKFLYSVRDPGPGRRAREILFLLRLAGIFEEMGNCDGLELYLTPGNGESADATAVLGGVDGEMLCRGRRIGEEDVMRTLGPVEDRGGTVVYVCGVPQMTERLVEKAKGADGMVEGHVLSERWIYD